MNNILTKKYVEFFKELEDIGEMPKDSLQNFENNKTLILVSALGCDLTVEFRKEVYNSTLQIRNISRSDDYDENSPADSDSDSNEKNN